MAENEVVAGMSEPQESMPWFKRKWVMLALAVALGIMLMAMLGGGFLNARKAKALQTEIVTLKKELKAKAQAHDALQEQVLALSAQLDLLKAHAVAHSSSAGASEKAEAGNQASATVPGAEKSVVTLPSLAGEKKGGDNAKPEVKASAIPAPPLPEGKPGAAAGTAPQAAKSGRAEPEAVRCDFAGKTAEQQADMLKRCVSAMEAPSKPRPGK